MPVAAFELVVAGAAVQRVVAGSADDAGDATFARRIYLDLAGTIPSADEARRFLADEAPDNWTATLADFDGPGDEAG